MTKDEKAFVMAYGEALLEMEKRISNMIPKWVKYKIIGLGQEPVYVISTYPDDVCTRLTEKGFTREASKAWG